MIALASSFDCRAPLACAVPGCVTDRPPTRSTYLGWWLTVQQCNHARRQSECESRLRRQIAGGASPLCRSSTASKNHNIKLICGAVLNFSLLSSKKRHPEHNLGFGCRCTILCTGRARGYTKRYITFATCWSEQPSGSDECIFGIAGEAAEATSKRHHVQGDSDMVILDHAIITAASQKDFRF